MITYTLDLVSNALVKKIPLPDTTLGHQIARLLAYDIEAGYAEAEPIRNLVPEWLNPWTGRFTMRFDQLCMAYCVNRLPREKDTEPDWNRAEDFAKMCAGSDLIKEAYKKAVGWGDFFSALDTMHALVIEK